MRKLRSILIGLALILVIILFFFSVGCTIHTIASGNLEATSGWLQVSIDSLGIPALIFALLSLRQQLKDLQSTPEIDLGVVRGGLPLSEIDKLKSLPSHIEVTQDYPAFSLVISNKGKVAIKFARIHFEYSSFAHRDSLPQPQGLLKAHNTNPFKCKNNMDFIFESGPGWVIYPLSTVTFIFHITTSISHDEAAQNNERPAPYKYAFKCTIWAEGLEKPVSKELTVEVTRSPTFSEKLKEYSENQAEGKFRPSD